MVERYDFLPSSAIQALEQQQFSKLWNVDMATLAFNINNVKLSE